MFRKSKTSIYPLKPISFSSRKINMFNYEILTTKNCDAFPYASQ